MAGSNERGAQRRLVLGGAVAMLAVAAAGCEGEEACLMDEDCKRDEVCARSAECLPNSQVRQVRVRWTIRGAAADATTCATVEPLRIDFLSDRTGDQLTYEPLACSSGLFTLDKMPSRMRQVQISGSRITAVRSGFPADGEVQLDLR